MKRDFAALARGPFDVLVIGGGIYGAWTAYDAALRGLRVALVERADWSAGTSSASSKLIHGGLRYLEQLHIGLVRKSLEERRRLATLGPHRVRPLPFVIPVYAGDRVGRFRLRVGLWLYDRLVGRDRVVGRHAALRRDEVLEGSPFLTPRGLRGGFRYSDCASDDARYGLEVVAGAFGAGAATVNYARVTRLLLEDGRVRGAEIRDEEEGRTLELRASATIACMGPWLSELLADAPALRGRFRLTRGVHLVLPGLSVEHAVLLTARSDGRVFFLIPWYGRTLLGTTDTEYDASPDRVAAEHSDVRYLLDEANRVLGPARWTEDDVIASFAGLRTLQNEPAAAPSTVTREWSLENPLPGLLVPIGGKYTSARSDAAEAVDRLLELLGRAARKCPTEDRAFPWAPAEPFDAWYARVVAAGVALGIDESTARAAALRFGARVDDVQQRVREQPDLGRRIHPDLPFCRAEVVHAVEQEMARTLEDVLRRRIPLTLLARIDRPLARGVADLVGDRLGWPEPRREEEAATLVADARRSASFVRDEPTRPAADPAGPAVATAWHSEHVAVALDLGTTRIKGGLLDPEGRLVGVVSEPAPQVSGPEPGRAGRGAPDDATVRESSPAEYVAAASAVLERLWADTGTAPMGLATQRSSFLLWNPADGMPATSLISWQDRRASRWCERNREREAETVRRTGLPLSPHYAGPKLASLCAEDPTLREALARGALLFGTLETFLLWCWTDGERHETDLTVAARTLMADPRRGRWDPDMLQLFGVPEAALPRIVDTAGRAVRLRSGPTVAASIADQAASLLAVLGRRPDAALVNLGTGGFVLRPTGATMAARTGYLAGPAFAGGGEQLYAMEGTINGAATSADRQGLGPTPLGDADPTPDAYCLPDATGVGSPYWLPERTTTFSDAARVLDGAGRRRIAIEGILFRIREILEDLFPDAPPARVVLSGGLVRDPVVAPGLAACLGRPVELATEAETTLLGAARVAAGQPPDEGSVPTRAVPPGDRGAYLHAKFDRWKVWLREVLS